MKLQNYLLMAFAFIICIPFGIAFGLVGIWVGIIENLILGIKKEHLEYKKYKSYKIEKFDINYHGKSRPFLQMDSDPNIIYFYFEQIVFAYLYFIILSVLILYLGPKRIYGLLVKYLPMLTPKVLYLSLKKSLTRKNKKIKILIVEDEVEQAEAMAELLGESGHYEPLIAHNGEEGLEMLQSNSRWFGFARNKIQVILLDLKMPKMNGLQFLKKVREQEYYINFIPVVITSAYEDNDKWGQVTHPAYGRASYYIKKPIIPDELLSLISRILGGEWSYLIDETLKIHNKRYSELSKISKEKI